MLKQRIMTAVVGLPLLLSTLIWGPKLLVCAVLVVSSGFCVFEFAQMLFPAMRRRLLKDSSGNTRDSRWPPIFCVLSAFSLYFIATIDLPGAERGGIIGVFAVVMLVGTFSGKSIEDSVINICVGILSLCYACLPWLSMWDLYLMGDHGRYFLLMLAIVMMGDSGAYFAGLHFGKTKLAPRYSPKKTWEGVIGGLLASCIGATVMNAIFNFELGPHWLILLIAIVSGFAGVLGDLVESTFKRFSEVKDSGNIFPGHGGFLDRADSVLFAGPAIWVIFYIFHYVTP